MAWQYFFFNLCFSHCCIIIPQNTSIIKIY